MQFITFPQISPQLPIQGSTGVKVNKGYVFSVPLVLTDAPSQTYAYPDISNMKVGGVFDQYNGNNDLTNGYGILRKRIAKSTNNVPGQPTGLNNFPDDWKISTNFSTILPANIYYCDELGNVISESAAVQMGTIRQKVFILLKPVTDVEHNTDYNVLVEPYLPYKTLNLISSTPGGGEGS